MMVDKIDINLENIHANDSDFKEYGISSKTIEKIEAVIVKEENANKDFAISFFAPSIVNNSSLQTKSTTTSYYT